MSRLSHDEFYSKLNRHGWTARKGAMIATIVCVLLIAGTTTAIAWVTATGRNFQKVESVERAPQGHVVRTHGWGGYYIGVYAGRRHFGGGGRIH